MRDEQNWVDSVIETAAREARDEAGRPVEGVEAAGSGLGDNTQRVTSMAFRTASGAAPMAGAQLVATGGPSPRPVP